MTNVNEFIYIVIFMYVSDKRIIGRSSFYFVNLFYRFGIGLENKIRENWEFSGTPVNVGMPISPPFNNISFASATLSSSIFFIMVSILISRIYHRRHLSVLRGKERFLPLKRALSVPPRSRLFLPVRRLR